MGDTASLRYGKFPLWNALKNHPDRELHKFPLITQIPKIIYQVLLGA